MIEKFRDINFRSKRRALIDQLETILNDYADQKLSSRQVFYQFVVRSWLANEERSYKLVTALITDARYAGIVDWDVIEDRGREPVIPLEFTDLSQRVSSALNNYRLPRWASQPRYAELWVEKQALAGVLSPIASKWHMPLLVNKGYSSASAMKAAADRMIENTVNSIGESKPARILYLGDHDPSGEDMVRDIRDRLTEFGVPDLEVVKVGLTMDQIREWNPPPNPAKVTDSRAAAYIAKYGDESWELDALPPKELNRIVEQAIHAIVDVDRMNEIIDREKLDKARLREAVANLITQAG